MSKRTTRRARARKAKKELLQAKKVKKNKWPYAFSHNSISGEEQAERNEERLNTFFLTVVCGIIIFLLFVFFFEITKEL